MLAAALVTWGLAEEASPVEGAPRAASFSVAYRADADCPSQAEFQAAILARAPSATPAEAGAEVSFDVELRTQPNQRRRLRVALADGSSQDREIDADDCNEAMQSMAVIAAMILEARGREVAAEAPPPQPPPAAPASAPESPVATPRSPAPVAASARAARATWLGLSGGIGAESGAAPRPMLAPRLGLELASRTAEDTLSPSVRLSALLGQATVDTSIGDARFRLIVARLHACGLRFGSLKAALRLCALFDGGVLLGQGIDALNQRSQTMLWLGAGLGALASLSVSERSSLEAGTGGRALIVRDHFVFAPSTDIHQVPDFAWDFHLGLSYQLW